MFIRYNNGRRSIILIADRQASNYTALRSLWHEGGHFALRETLKENSPEYTDFLDDLYNSKFKLQIMDHAQTLYKEFNLNTPEGQRSAADEWWARTVAEENFAQGDPALWVALDKFIAIVRKMLKRIGLRVSMTRAEIRDMMRRAYREMEREAATGMGGEVAGVSADTARQLAPTFYSQMGSAHFHQYVLAALDLEQAMLRVYSEREGHLAEISKTRFPYSA